MKILKKMFSRKNNNEFYFSMILVFLTLAIVFNHRFKNPAEMFYNVHKTNPISISQFNSNLKDNLSKNDYDNMIKTILMNHSYIWGYNIFLGEDYVYNNRELNNLLIQSQNFYNILDSNFQWEEFPNGVYSKYLNRRKNKCISNKYIRIREYYE